jgi:hypothetical protein
MKKRLAVCFSGQPRTWRRVISSWSSFLNSDQYQIDVFCHAWNFNSASANIYKSPESIKLPQSEIDDLMSHLKPVRAKIENERRFVATSPDQSMSNPAHLSQFYGIMESARLKRSHEIENRFVYDAVIRTRYDILVETNVASTIADVLPNTLHGFDLKFNYSNKSCMISDLFWLSDGLTYDRIADLYLDSIKISKRWFQDGYGPEHVLFHHLKTNQIETVNHPWRISIMREPVSGGMSDNA